MEYFFYLFATLTVLSALGILFTNNLMNASFLLMVCFICVASLFVLSGADFLAITQVMVYIGGILLLVLFGVMLSKRQSSDKKIKNVFPFLGVIIGSTVFYLIILMMRAFSPFQVLAENSGISQSTVRQIGFNLMTSYLIPFELAGLLLLVALIGSVFIAGKIR